MIIHHNGEHIGRRSVRAKQDEIIKIFIIPPYITLDMVGYFCFSIRHAETDSKGGVEKVFLVAVRATKGVITFRLTYCR